jgi:cupin superfamily acireductone dioxygenase involved in methionine salvage
MTFGITQDQWELNLKKKHSHYSVTFFTKYSTTKINDMLRTHGYTKSQINHVVKTTNKYKKHLKNPKGTHVHLFDKATIKKINGILMR